MLPCILQGASILFLPELRLQLIFFYPGALPAAGSASEYYQISHIYSSPFYVFSPHPAPVAPPLPLTDI